MISVIIPVYNVEKYIGDLIKSLINQSFKDFEVIIVDDGSTDNSIEIAERILKPTNLVYKIIHQQNKGQSVARNTGIKNSVSEWIVIPDSDDVLHPDYLKMLYETVVTYNSNVAYCNFKLVMDGNNMFVFDKYKNDVTDMSSFECMENFVRGKWIGPWSIIINRDFFISKSLWFDEESRYDEDLIFVTKLICEIDKIYEIHANLYVYRKRADSVLNGSNGMRIINGYKRIFLLSEYLLKNESEAACYFYKYGFGNLVLAKARNCAKRFEYENYKSIIEKLEAKKYIQKYIEVAPLSRKIASKIFIFSNRMFYYIAKVY